MAHAVQNKKLTEILNIERAMNKKIAILRGINVGGKRKILMSDLKTLCGKLGLKNVTTHIQSGNIIFDSDQENAELENKLEQTIRNNPFFDEHADINQLHLTFLKDKPKKENVETILSCDYEPDKCKIDGQNVFIYCAGKYHQSKLSNNFFEKKLKVGATTRNWKTVLKLRELVNGKIN